MKPEESNETTTAKDCKERHSNHGDIERENACVRESAENTGRQTGVILINGDSRRRNIRRLIVILILIFI